MLNNNNKKKKPRTGKKVKNKKKWEKVCIDYCKRLTSIFRNSL